MPNRKLHVGNFLPFTLSPYFIRYFPIYQKTIIPANKFVIQLRGFKQLKISQKHKKHGTESLSK